MLTPDASVIQLLKNIEAGRKARANTSASADFLRALPDGAGGNQAVVTGYNTLLEILLSRGSTSPENQREIQGQLAGVSRGLGANIGDRSAGLAQIIDQAVGAIRERSEAVEAQLAAERQRDDLSLVKAMLIDPALRNRGRAVQGIQNSARLAEQRAAGRSALYQGIGEILQTAGKAYGSIKNKSGPLAGIFGPKPE